MIITKIFFILLIIICAVFYVLYIGDFSFVLFIVIAAVPLLLFISMLISKKLIRSQFYVKNNSVAKNEIFDVQLSVQNKSFIPIGKAEAVIEYYNIINKQINNFVLSFPIQPLNSQRITFQLSSKFSGILIIRLAYIKIYDPLRIFNFKICKNISEKTAVLPEGHEINAFLNQTSRFDDESSVYSEYRPGDDPSEVFDLRDYSQGDKLNRIHWKLSSKKDEFIVKDYSLPIDSPAMIFVNLSCKDNSEYSLPVFDTLLEVLVSLSQFYISNDRIHRVVYFNTLIKKFVEKTISDYDSLSSLISELIYSCENINDVKSPEIYFADNTDLSLASFAYVSSEENEKIFSYIDENIDSDSKNAVIITKNENEYVNKTDSYCSLSITPVYIGKISSSIKGIEL